MASESKPQRTQGVKPPLRHQRRGGMLAMDSEQAAKMLLFGVVAAVILAAVAFIAFGYYFSVVRPRNRTVLQADDITVSYSAMKRRVNYEYLLNPTQFTSQQALGSLPIGAYSALLTELTHINRAEAEQGVTATPEEIDASLRAKLGIAPNAEQGAFAEQLRAELDRTGLTDSEYRRLVRAELLQEKVQAKFKAELPAAVQQAKLEVIATNELPLAETAAGRVRAGEAWADVAKDMSADPSVGTTGGLIDFTPTELVSAAYSDYASTGAVGEISAPIESNGVFYVVRVVERADMPLTDVQKPQYEGYLYNKWVTDAQANMRVVDNWTDDIDGQSDALAPIFDQVTRFLEEQQQQAVPTAPSQPIVVPTAGAPVVPDAPVVPEVSPANGQ